MMGMYYLRQSKKSADYDAQNPMHEDEDDDEIIEDGGVTMNPIQKQTEEYTSASGSYGDRTSVLDDAP